MRKEGIENILKELGSYEYNSTQEAIETGIHGYLDDNTHILYNEKGIQDLYDDMKFIFDDFIEEYPAIEDYKKYFTMI